MKDARKLATDAEFCEFAGLTPAQSKQLRYLGKGPKFIKVTGHQVRYRWSDVEAWLEANTRQSTGEQPGAA
ncbi:helix-turn-helix transcriptional regulator [Nocardia sp. Marseille-Q1738]